MKIEHIHLKDFLGVQLVSVATPQPVQLFAGGNMAGKSSVRDAVALAITGALPRIALKKDAGALVREGASGADCEVRAGEEVYSFGISTAGKLSQPKNLRPEFAFVLEAQRFASLPVDERRKYLFELMRVKMTPTDVVAELLQLGHDKDRVAMVQPLLRAGFEGAAKDAKERATAGKGAWRQITGEVWGSEKAVGWKATVPASDAEKAKALATELAHLEVAIGQWNEQKGKLKADQAHRERRAAELPGLREIVALEQRRREKIIVDETELARLKPLLDRALADAGAGPRDGTLHELAAAMHALVKLVGSFELEPAEQPTLDHAKLVLANYEALHGRIGASPDPEAVGRAERLKKAYQTCQSAVDHGKRDLNASLEAKAQIVHIEAELGQPFDADALAQAEQQIADLTAKRTELQAQADAAKQLQKAAEQAEAKTKSAADAHADIMAWDALGDALSPGGLPAALLARALKPINDRLAMSFDGSGWAPPTIGDDMQITVEGRDYRLLSVSERWRTDALIAEAISLLSGMRLLVLDGFDVLEPNARGELIGWIDMLVCQNELDSALLFGTLKAPPTGMPDTVGVHWIVNGAEAQTLKEAA